MKAKLFLLVFLFFCVNITSNSQSFGGFPPSFEWMQIENDTVSIIFPKGLEKQAIRVANMIDYMSKNNNQSIGKKVRKIDIVLQNQTTISNGYVGLAPFRSEFFTTPMQSNMLGSLPWLDLLAIHEYRHVQQFNNSLNGLTYIPYILFGELGWAVATSAVPNWFWEGDAVLQETALSNQGRGRLPYFFNDFRAIALEPKSAGFAYIKLRNGSLKDFVPDHYKLGYLICNYGRNKYGNDFWANVFRRATKFYSLYPFSRAVRKYSFDKMNTRNLYVSALDDFQDKLREEIRNIDTTEVQNFSNSKDKNVVTSYRYPQYINNDEWIVLKKSYDRAGQFVLINSNFDEVYLEYQGFVLDDYFHYQKNKIIWAELNFDIRWGNYDYSVLKTYNLKTNVVKQLTFKTKYFSPAFNSKTDRIVVVEVTPDIQYFIKILDANGKVLKTLPNPQNYFYSYPKFSENENEIIVSVRDKIGQMALAAIEIESGNMRLLTDFSFHVIGLHTSKNGNIYFESSYNGVDNIYVVPMAGGVVKQVTNRVLGNYQMTLNEAGDEMVFSEFSIRGYKLKKLKLDESRFREFNIINFSKQNKFSNIAIDQEGGDVASKMDTTRNYDIKPYPIKQNLVNFHSRYPILSNQEIGLGLISNNILNNFQLGLSGYYNFNEKAAFYDLNFQSGKYFLVTDFGLSGNSKRIINTLGTTITEHGAYFRLLLPLNLTKNYFRRSFTPYIGTQLRYLNYENVFLRNYQQPITDTVITRIDDYNSFGLFFNGGFNFVNAQRSAIQNIYTPFGQYVKFNAQSLYRAGEDKQSGQITTEYEFAFPGFARNHHLVVEGNLLYETSARYYRSSNTFFNPRGFRLNENFQYVGLFSRIGGNYHFPIFYPDIGLRGTIYIYRIRGNVFGDFGVVYLPELNIEQQVYSAGGELIFDFNLFNSLPISLGLRANLFLDKTIYKDLPLVYQGIPIEIFFPIKRL